MCPRHALRAAGVPAMAKFHTYDAIYSYFTCSSAKNQCDDESKLLFDLEFTKTKGMSFHYSETYYYSDFFSAVFYEKVISYHYFN